MRTQESSQEGMNSRRTTTLSHKFHFRLSSTRAADSLSILHFLLSFHTLFQLLSHSLSVSPLTCSCLKFIPSGIWPTHDFDLVRETNEKLGKVLVVFAWCNLEIMKMKFDPKMHGNLGEQHSPNFITPFNVEYFTAHSIHFSTQQHWH